MLAQTYAQRTKGVKFNPMEVDSKVRHFTSKSDYLSRKASSGIIKKGAANLPKPKSAASLDISDDAKQKAKKLSEVPSKIKEKVKEGARASQHILGQAAGAIKSAVANTPGLSSLPIPDFETTNVKKSSASKEAMPKTIDTPGIFFIKGFQLNPFYDDKMGISGMAENIPGAYDFSWDDEDAIMDLVKRRPVSQPIILVGHGMGGDAVVNIANKLNTMEHGFRKVDLAVTLDSIGFDNDIIPQNIEENLNIISDADLFFNDGPNIARNREMTKVINTLRGESHSELPESVEVQFEVFDRINAKLMNAVALKNHKIQKN